MIKAAFFDVDGTLVSFQLGVVTDRLHADLLALRDRGLLLILATGRSRQDLARTGMLRDLRFDAYVTLNGHCCYNDQGVYLDRPICRGDLEGACKVLRARPELAALMASDGESYVSQLNGRALEIFSYMHTPPYPVRPPEWMLERKIYQFIPLVEAGEEALFLDVMPHCTYTRWHPKGVDIIPAGEGKAEGIRATLEAYGLKREEIVAFGDGGNDLSMLALAGTSVAMGNAVQAVKDQADYVTDTVEADGVSKALRHLGLLPG